MKSPLFNSTLLSLIAAAGVLALSSPTKVTAAVSGDAYVSTGPTVTRVTAGGTKLTLPLTILTPSGEVADQSGNLFVADTLTNSIVKIDSDGNQTTFASGLNHPGNLALDASGNLYVANSGTNSVVKIGPGGKKTTVATGLNNPQGIAVDPSGHIYVSNAGNNTIAEINPNGTKSTFVSTGLNSPAGLAFDGSGNLLVANSGSNDIVKVAPDGSTSTVASATLHDPKGVASDGAGNILVSDNGSGSILQISPSGATRAVATSLTMPNQLALAPGTHQLLNISTRGLVGSGDDVLIAGFIVRGDDGASVGESKVIVRALGPSLTSSGITDPLPDPTLELHNASGTLIASNDNWQDTQKSQIQATGLAPKNPNEAAIVTTLADGAYTAIVAGANGGMGVALVEVYKLTDSTGL